MSPIARFAAAKVEWPRSTEEPLEAFRFIFDPLHAALCLHLPPVCS